MANDKYEYGEKFRTPPFTAAFVRIFDNPQVDETSGRKTWSVVAIFPKDADLKVFKKAFNETAKLMWGDKAANMVKHRSFRSPFKDGDDFRDREGNLYKGFEPGMQCIKLSSSQGAPGVVDRKARKISDKDGTTLVEKGSTPDEDIFEELEINKIYAGATFEATSVPQGYDRSDGLGISFKLENMRKLGDGEPLTSGGRAKAEDDFEPIDDADGGFDGADEDEDMLA
jgi:hypothetical protein